MPHIPAGPIRVWSRTTCEASKLIIGRAFRMFSTVSFTSYVCTLVQGVSALASNLRSGSVLVAKSDT